MSIIVDETVAPHLAEELSRFKQDLIGDGWRVAPIHTDAPRMLDESYVWANEADPPGPIKNSNFPLKQDYIDEIQDVKNMIADDVEYADGFDGELEQVILIGHVTVPYSGLDGHYDGNHEDRAFPNDLYYADANASPITWGDEYYNPEQPNGGDTAHELTTNQAGDGRFDSEGVPGDSQTVTINSGTGQFKLSFTRQSLTSTTPWLDYNVSPGQLRTAINDLPSVEGSLIGEDPGFVTVTQANNVYTINLLGSLSGQDQPLFAKQESGVSITIGSVNNGGTEYGISRIDMANLDAAFPTSETATEFESRLISQYLDRDHVWRMAEAPVAQPAMALLDPIGNNTSIEALLADVVGEGNVVHDSNHTWLGEFGQANPTHYLFASIADFGDADVVWKNMALHTRTITSYDFAAKPVRGVFTTVHGSYMGDWNSRSLRGNEAFKDDNGSDLFPVSPNHPIRANLARSVLAGDGDALISFLMPRTGGPGQGLVQGDAPLALGFPVGEGFRYGLSEFGAFYGANTLFGDPTIRMSYVKPVSDVVQNHRSVGRFRDGDLDWVCRRDRRVPRLSRRLIHRAVRARLRHDHGQWREQLHFHRHVAGRQVRVHGSRGAGGADRGRRLRQR